MTLCPPANWMLVGTLSYTTRSYASSCVGLLTPPTMVSEMSGGGEAGGAGGDGGGGVGGGGNAGGGCCGGGGTRSSVNVSAGVCDTVSVDDPVVVRMSPSKLAPSMVSSRSSAWPSSLACTHTRHVVAKSLMSIWSAVTVPGNRFSSAERTASTSMVDSLRRENAAWNVCKTATARLAGCASVKHAYSTTHGVDGGGGGLALGSVMLTSTPAPVPGPTAGAPGGGGGGGVAGGSAGGVDWPGGSGGGGGEASRPGLLPSATTTPTTMPRSKIRIAMMPQNRRRSYVC